MRKQHNLIQCEFAAALDISDKTVSKWECGNGMPGLSLMKPVCEILEINLGIVDYVGMIIWAYDDSKNFKDFETDIYSQAI